jgi:hypothetical protein
MKGATMNLEHALAASARLHVTLAVAGVVLAALTTATPAFACTCPSVSDNYCLDIGMSGVGSPYLWGHAAWKTTDRTWRGADCSGFLIKAWQVPRLSVITEDYHPYGTWHIFTQTYHWYAISRANLWKADAVGYPDPDGSGPRTGHVVLYYAGDPYSRGLCLEAPGSGQTIRMAWRDISGSQWRFRRRHNLRATLGPG